MEIGETLEVRTRAAWRAWLARNHARKKEIWLVYYAKASGKRTITYNDSVDEAISFGWIDSIQKTLSPESRAQRFTPRRKGSPVSEMNKARARRLVREGRMTAAGRAALGSALRRERVVVTAFVIEHPRGVFLFDTGFSPEPRKMVDLYKPVYMRPIEEALRAAGHGITDVKLIANCHFHADHAGGNRHFARTPIFVQKRELAHARQENDYTHLPHVADFPGAALEEVDGDAEPWPGIQIVPTPGHSPGHQSLVVETT